MKFQKNGKFFLKNILKISTLILVFFIVSCNKDEDKSTDMPTTSDKTDLLSQHSSFEISIAGTPPPTVIEIANTMYTEPNSAYGMTAVIDFITNTDNTIDILWVGKDNNRHLSRISLANKSLVKDFVIPSKANSGTGVFLGFDSLGGNKFVIGYSKANSSGDQKAEAWYTAFDGNSGAELFSTRIFGELSLVTSNSKGEPSQAGSALVRYNSKDNVIGVYLAHTNRSANDGVRHQGGWLGFLNGTTGKLITNTSGNPIGDTWFYSHNFDQRGIFSKEGKFYVLAHGDAYSRALGFNKFSHVNGNEGGIEYFKIAGSIGDNITNTTTGDLEELSDGNVAIVYSTSNGRKNRDLKLVLLNSVKESTPDKDPVIAKQVWINESAGTEYTGWGSKVVQFGDKILIGWNTFNGKTPLNSKLCLYDLNETLVSSPVVLPNSMLYPTQSIKKTPDGSKVVFVSYGGANKLVVNVIATK